MTNMPLAAAFVAAAVLLADTAAAQERAAISLTPANAAQWDIAGHVGWFGSYKPDIGAEWDDWYNALAGGVSAGRYLTPHLKTEIHAVMAREGRIYTHEPVSPTDPYPFFRAREHYFRATSVDAGLFYQFFENQWFHPFAGGGLEAVREHHRVRVPEQFLPPRNPGGPPVPVPAIVFTPEVTYSARPFVATGFKWYVSERAFVRTTLQVSFGRRSTSQVWTAGIGADL